jgi:hypothetical protein
MSQRLVKLFRDMSELTAPECAKVCRVPYSCCDPMYCDLTEEYARDNGVTLTITEHPKLKYMGPTGCTVEPHLRPLCTLHTCAVNSYGFKPGDPEWTKRYFKLRDEIDHLLAVNAELQERSNASD